MFEVQPRYQGELAVDYALRVVHHNIMTLHLEPGQIIRENELTERLGISRTPLREALIQLAAMYLIDIVPQSSTRVSLIDSDLIKEGIFLRLQVEPAIAERVCAEIGENDIMRLEDMLALQKRLLESGRFEELLVQDNAFHEKLYQICGAEKTFRAVSAICGQYNIMRTLSLYHYTTKIAIREHGGILKAIKERDAAAARKIMIEHINRHSKEYKTIEKNFPRYFIRVEGA